MLPFLVGSPTFLDASLFKLEPPPTRTAAFCWFPSEREYIHFFGGSPPLFRWIPP
ncbi:MAG: hypothetical protein L0210_08640 [Rhodospirillales bacterium]|nr:hypothetical protein [Rhodospirillales bacterium]